MNIDTYNNLIQSFRRDGDKQANAKRIEYTESKGDADVLANFKATAVDLDLDSLQVLGIFMKKHWSSIINYIKTGKVHSDEPIAGRIMDLIQYLELTHATIVEKKHLQDKGDKDIPLVRDEGVWANPFAGLEEQMTKTTAAIRDSVEFVDPPTIINKDTVKESLMDIKKDC